MATFGDTSFGGSTFPSGVDRLMVSKYTLSEAATVTSIWIYVNVTSGTSDWKGVVLSDSSGPASVLIVSSAVTVTTSGWYQCTASGSLSAGDYWIGSISNSNGAQQHGVDATGGPDLLTANGTFSYASPPGSWPGTDNTYSGQGLNAYVEYTPSAVGDRYSTRAQIIRAPRTV